MIKHLFSFKGRIRRTEYGLTFLFATLYSILTGVFAESLPSFLTGILMIGIFPLIWVIYAQGAKRCHDIGKSGWWQLIPFFAYYMLFANSDGENKYGPPIPKD
jgi:uncharacterized membrane protein YhaH (DUF805 family)